MVVLECILVYITKFSGWESYIGASLFIWLDTHIQCISFDTMTQVLYNYDMMQIIYKGLIAVRSNGDKYKPPRKDHTWRNFKKIH